MSRCTSLRSKIQERLTADGTELSTPKTTSWLTQDRCERDREHVASQVLADVMTVTGQVVRPRALSRREGPGIDQVPPGPGQRLGLVPKPIAKR